MSRQRQHPRALPGLTMVKMEWILSG